MKKLVLLAIFISTFVLAQEESLISHQVKKGETLTSIAERYNVSVDRLYVLNPTLIDGIKENSIIQIPNKKNNSITQKKHLVKVNETLYSISTLYNIDIKSIELLNQEALKEGLKIGQILIIPEDNIPIIEANNSTIFKNEHVVLSKETLFSIARKYNVSVQDLDKINTEALEDGLQIGETIKIPNKKKTISGQARIITDETVFHEVLAKETKYSIAKKYSITIEQLENQNPEIINGLTIGNRLAINKKRVEPKNENEELMIALAEKQVVIEKSKAKVLEIEDLQDKLNVQKQINQKVLKVNSLEVNLNEIDETKGGSVDKLKLVLQANKNIQEILLSKLDSLVVTMEDDLEILRNTEINDLEETKNLQKTSMQNSRESNKMLFELKKDLTSNRKIYAELVNKVKRIYVAENNEYNKKIRENYKDRKQNIEEEELQATIKTIQKTQESNDKRNDQLFAKIVSIDAEKNKEFKNRIAKATFYSAESRNYDDKLAQVKLKRYQNKVIEENKNNPNASLPKEEMGKMVDKKDFISKESLKIEVLKNIKDIEDGYYIVVNTFLEADKRDTLTKELTDLGEINTNFFYNYNTFSYYVYTRKFNKVEDAIIEYNKNIESPLYKNMFIVQIKSEQ